MTRSLRAAAGSASTYRVTPRRRLLVGRRAKVRRGLYRETAVDGQIFGGHAAGCEALLEARPYSLPRQARELANGSNRAGFVLHDETRQPILDDLRHGAAVECDYGVPHAIASIIVRPNGSGQSIETRRAIAPLRKSGF